jgi:hypothetical protein
VTWSAGRQLPGLADPSPKMEADQSEAEARAGTRFATGRQPLCGPQEQDQDPRQQADGGVARQKPNPCGRSGHRKDDGDEYAAASTGVIQPTEAERTQWPEDEGCSIEAKAADSAVARSAAGKK